jgi:YHS domain-containing protein
VQDPQIQLQELGVKIPDLVDPSREAVLDPAHRSFVNYETFFFADEADKRRFDADPTGACGILTDPVSKERFRPGSASPRETYDGRVYYFFSETNRAAFMKEPGAYARPNYDKIEIPSMPMSMPIPTPQ